MSKSFFQPIRMESQYVPTKLQTVKTWDETNFTNAFDGEIVVLGAFAPEPIYTAAFTTAAGVATTVTDINTRYAKLPAAAADGVCVIDVSGVSTAGSFTAENTYRIGANTIGLFAEAGTPVRARKLVVGDTFMTGEDNCTAALTVNQFASVDATGKWAPEATAPATGAYVQIIDKLTVSQGVTANVTAYRMLVVKNAAI